jgi:hypothetical protein
MQDNAGIHTPRAAKRWLDSKRIWYIKWPAYSPDLNAIEQLWWHLKKRKFKHYPQFNNYSIAREEWNDFCEALQECWMSIPKKLIKSLIFSMPQHMEACRKARPPGDGKPSIDHITRVFTPKSPIYTLLWLHYCIVKFWLLVLIGVARALLKQTFDLVLYAVRLAKKQPLESGRIVRGDAQTCKPSHCCHARGYPELF